MPIRRKIVRIGGSNAIFIPKSWLELIELKHGKVEAVAMEVNNELTIKPILTKRETSNE